MHVQLSRAAERAAFGVGARPVKRPRREPPFDLQRARATAFALGFGADEITAEEAELLPLGLSTAKYVLVSPFRRCVTLQPMMGSLYDHRRAKPIDTAKHP